MRANLVFDPAHGSGYGIIEIFDAPENIETRVVIKRLSDGMFLSSGGWINEEVSIAPDRWESVNRLLRLWFGPEVIDDLSGNDRYELTLPGSGSCPLFPAPIRQSVIVNDSGFGTYSPLPQQPNASPGDTVTDRIIYEGVEQDPQAVPDIGDPGLPSGVAAGPVGAISEKPKKKYGCLILCIALVFIWAGGGWALWHAAKDAPAASKDSSFSIEIIPKATDSSIAGEPEDAESNEKRPEKK